MPWNIDDFELGDDDNQQIWTQSPGIQDEIHGRNENMNFGCQQAMVGDEDFGFEPLPWVPDLVGKKYGEAGSLLIVGSAYAPFLSRYGGGRNAIPRLAYKWAQTAAQFQRLFVEEVVGTDKAYYAKLEQLTEGLLEKSQICLTDLCKGSFVERRIEEVDPHPNEPHHFGHEIRCRDHGGDTVVRSDGGRTLFLNCANHAGAWPWLRNRIEKATRIVALGSLAEHTLLRILCSRYENSEIVENSTNHEFAEAELFPADWLANQTNHAFHAPDWWSRPANRWWNVDLGDANPRQILPVTHPRNLGANNLARWRDRLAEFMR